MATRSTRSTADQRAALIRLRADLREALDMLPSRYWITHDQRAAYETVLRHLENWIGWEDE